jgi:hypothetical protein
MTEATELARLIIHFTDGTSLDAAAPRQATDPMRVLQNVRRAMESDKLMVEIDGQLFLIPLNNVKYVQLSPAPDALPEGVIRGATLVS